MFLFYSKAFSWPSSAFPCNHDSVLNENKIYFKGRVFILMKKLKFRFYLIHLKKALWTTLNRCFLSLTWSISTMNIKMKIAINLKINIIRSFEISILTHTCMLNVECFQEVSGWKRINVVPCAVLSKCIVLLVINWLDPGRSGALLPSLSCRIETCRTATDVVILFSVKLVVLR